MMVDYGNLLNEAHFRGRPIYRVPAIASYRWYAGSPEDQNLVQTMELRPTDSGLYFAQEVPLGLLSERWPE